MIFSGNQEQTASPTTTGGAPCSKYPPRLDLEEDESDDNEYSFASGQSPLGHYSAASYFQAHDGAGSVENRANQYYLSHVGASFMSTMWAGATQAANQTDDQDKVQKAVDACSSRLRRDGETRDLTCRHGDGSWCERCAIRIEKNLGSSTPRVVPDISVLESPYRKDRRSEKAHFPRQEGDDLHPCVDSKQGEFQANPQGMGISGGIAETGEDQV
ncbi:hypothetical protein QBC40DRAFT_287747 [Triangularia verruculosa]|uniref:Uncharacterized protein n=1 Tax=Triangularia verruculosa TaxID=2587418 RepID=A0AAN6X9X7_9PEZI|nr:hypothetical protein QBC40DRAFT_287747 [Triangularia verruculosa]